MTVTPPQPSTTPGNGNRSRLVDRPPSSINDARLGAHPYRDKETPADGTPTPSGNRPLPSRLPNIPDSDALAPEDDEIDLGRLSYDQKNAGLVNDNERMTMDLAVGSFPGQDGNASSTVVTPGPSRAAVDRASSVPTGEVTSDASAFNSSTGGVTVATSPPTDPPLTADKGDKALDSLDFDSFPHIVDKILAFSSRNVRLAFRLTSSSLKQRVDDHFIPRHLSFRSTLIKTGRSDRHEDVVQLQKLTVYNWGTGHRNTLFTEAFCWALGGFRPNPPMGDEDSDDQPAPPHFQGPASTDPMGQAVASHATLAQLASRYTPPLPWWLLRSQPSRQAWRDFSTFTEAIDYDSASWASLSNLRPFLPNLRVVRVGQKDMGLASAGATIRAFKAVVFVPVRDALGALGPGPLRQFQSEELVINLMTFPCTTLAARIGSWALPASEPRRLTIVLHSSQAKEKGVRFPPRRAWSNTTPYLHHYEQVFALAARIVKWTSTTQVTIVGLERIQPHWFGAPSNLKPGTLIAAAEMRIEMLLQRYFTLPGDMLDMMARLHFLTNDVYEAAVGPKEYMLDTAPCPPPPTTLDDDDY